jgi:predicted secreted hydrolase
MKPKLLGSLLLIATHALGGEWQTAEPGYRFDFPRDHFCHPNFQTEWWYYTGNVQAPDGHRFGFELTFFRQANRLPSAADGTVSVTWRPDQVYLAHLALSDIDGQQFLNFDRLNRAGPGLAGASEKQARCWNGNWQVRWTALPTGTQELQAVTDRFNLRLRLAPLKPAVINGRDGVSRKGPKPGEASHYISFTRLQAEGQLHWSGKAYALRGLAWMDHEFFTEPADETLAGWDWFAIQLTNGEELLLYRLRRKSGQKDPYSSGTYVDSQGQSHFLTAEQFSLTPRETWESKESGAHYPVSWEISVPSLQLQLIEQTDLKAQELTAHTNVTPRYWEGAVRYSGTIHSQRVTGVGYLELTGYAGRVKLGSK